MNPLRWLRWKLLVAFLVIGGALYLFGLDPLAKWKVNDLGSLGEKARWTVGGIDLGILTGDLSLADLLVATARAAGGVAEAPEGAPDEKEKVLSADAAEIELSMNGLLRKRFVVDRIRVRAPNLRVDRRPDGSTNIGDLAGTETEAEAEEEAGEPTDWVAAAKKWYERIQKYREKLSRKKGEGREEGEDGSPEAAGPERRRALYVFEDRPGMVIHEVVAEGLEVDFSDASAPSPLPSLKNGLVSVTGLSSSPSVHDAPIGFKVEGDLEGSRLSLQGEIDLTGDVSKYMTEIRTGPLPASVIQAFVGKSLPVEISAGTVELSAKLGLDGDENLRIEPVLLTFQGVRLGEKAEHSRVAGVDAKRFVTAFNEASGQLGSEPIKIADLKITGTLSSPRFEWGETVLDLVRQGGEAFARAQLAKAEQKAREAVGEQAEKLRSELGEKIDDAIGKELGDSPLGEQIQDAVKEAGASLPDATKEVEKTTRKALEGLGIFKDRSAAPEKK
ncbi:MAG: DUF748 domain-containing protein [Planctomycetes bacterium]|nr:DUF748 domain-containing protein [Planctomycetota bacterium]